MLIDLKEVVQRYNLNIRGVIQVGAHWAEEHQVFSDLCIYDIVYVEPCKDAVYKLVCNLREDKNWTKCINGIWAVSYEKDVNTHHYVDDKFGVTIFNCACGEAKGAFSMYVSNNNQGQSNSLLRPNLHTIQHPEVIFDRYETVMVIPLDELPFKKEYFNLLMMDVQGAEGLVLKGAAKTLEYIDCIYTEVNRDYTYDGNILIDEMDKYLLQFGFMRVEIFWPSPNWSWGDAVYLKTLIK